MNAPLQSKVHSMDAPLEGWDAFHSLDNMPPTAAVILENLIPGAGQVDTRRGHVEYHDLGTGVPVETCASMDNGIESKLVVASAGGMWDITDTEVEVKAQQVDQLAPPATFTNDRWQTENFRKADESGIMVMCNGVDTTQIFDGTQIRDMITTGSDPAVTPDFIGCVAFKGRMYYWKDNDNAFYYAQAGSYEGNLKKFDLGSFTQQGGHLKFIITWTQQDSGDGKDDFIVFVFSTGEILLYQGDDPETAGYWEMVGRYFTAEPLSIRGQTQYGADAILMTRDGYVNLSSVIQQGRTSDVPAFSRLIHAAVTYRTEFNFHLFGWDVELFAKQGLIIFNVPLSDFTFEQHVMNTITQRWCKFTHLNVNCLEIHKERLFGGTQDGRVLAMLETTADEGEAIHFDCLYAFQYLEAPGYNKHLTAAELFSTIDDPVDVQLTGYADFDVPDLAPIFQPTQFDQGIWSINPATPPATLGSFWDTDYWSAQNTPFTKSGWQNISAFGNAVSLLVRFARVNESVVWRSTSIRYHLTGAQ